MNIRRLFLAALAAAAGAAAMPAEAHRGWYGGYAGWYGPNLGVYFGAPALSGPYAYPYYYAPGYYRYPPYWYGFAPYGYWAPPYAYPYPAYAYRGPTVYIQKPRVVAAAPSPPKAPPSRTPPPKAKTPPPVVDREVLSAKELFAFDSARLLEPQPRLDEIALALLRNPAITGVRITGYTDRLGSEAYNRRLSQRRADAVKDYLVKRGVSADRLVAVGLGAADPIAKCEGASGARLIACLEPNRRVEIAPFVIERPAG